VAILKHNRVPFPWLLETQATLAVENELLRFLSK